MLVFWIYIYIYILYVYIYIYDPQPLSWEGFVAVSLGGVWTYSLSLTTVLVGVPVSGKGRVGWQWRDNTGANFALLVVQTNWCLPILHVPLSVLHPISFLCRPCFIYWLRHTLYSTPLFTFLSYLIHPLYSGALIPAHTFAILPSITSTLTLRVAFRSALFRFSVTMTLNL
jgi:hypothetical protein